MHTYRVMYHGIQSTSDDVFNSSGPMGPSEFRYYYLLRSIYFVGYMVVMAFILLNLFSGFVIVTFQEEGVKEFHQVKLDRNQVRLVWL